MPPRLVLFICTGNFYRSRFAEAFFNHHAPARGLTWRAFSRGTAIHLAHGPLSPFTAAALDDLGIPHTATAPDRASLTAADLARADLRIALKEAEHRPAIRTAFPDWEDKVEYWSIHDIDVASPEHALPQVRAHVESLLNRLATP